MPANVRVLGSNAFAVDNDELTGKTTPVALITAPVHGTARGASYVASFACFAMEINCGDVMLATVDKTVFGGITKLTEADVNGIYKQITTF